MLSIAFLVASLVAGQDTAVFKDDSLRLAFTHPKTWTVAKKQKDVTILSLPIENSTDRGTLEITRAVYRSEPETWQLVQTHVNKQLQREVVRQWQQEILGVPMLLTQIRFADKGVSMNTLTGLLYTRTPQKLLFRLTGPESDFDKVLFEFQSAIQTLRSFDEKGLEPEDPSKPPVTVTTPLEKIDLRPPKKVTFEEKPTQAGPVVGPVVVDLVVSSANMQLRLPKGWTIEKVEGHRAEARHPSLQSSVVIQVFSLLDSDPPRNALFKQASESLQEFKSVGKREDTNNKASRGGMNVSAVWRTGDGGDGKHFTFDGTAVNDTHYALLAFRHAGEADRKLLEELLSIISVAPAP